MSPSRPLSCRGPPGDWKPLPDTSHIPLSRGTTGEPAGPPAAHVPIAAKAISHLPCAPRKTPHLSAGGAPPAWFPRSKLPVSHLLSRAKRSHLSTQGVRLRQEVRNNLLVITLCWEGREGRGELEDGAGGGWVGTEAPEVSAPQRLMGK